MPVDGSWELQKAIYAALTGDSTLMGMVTGVFDHVPAEQAHPYVVIGEDTAREWGAKGLDGQEHTLALHVWSRERGRKEIKEVMGEVYRILHDANLTLTGHILVNLRFEMAKSLLDEDGITYHGTTRFRAVTHGV